MQIDEGSSHKEYLDLSLTRRLFQKLHPEALATPQVTPSLSDFEREYVLIVAEQNRVCKLLADSQQASFITVLRGCLPIAAPYIQDAFEAASEDTPAKNSLNVLRSLL